MNIRMLLLFQVILS